MSEEIDYAARVQRGIALMDVKWPEWATEIDLEKLDISDSSQCVTAQYAGQKFGDYDFAEGMAQLDLTPGEYEQHGFTGPIGDWGSFAALSGLWKAEIERRRAQVQDAPAEPEASGR